MTAGRLWRVSGRSLAIVAALSGVLLLAGGRSGRGADDEKAAPKAKLDFLDERLREACEQASIKPSPLATDEEFLRRVYLDLIGRIPNIDEATAFLQTKESGKRQKLVMRLLEHPDFAKNFANLWTVLLIGRKTRDRDVNRGALSAWLRKQFNGDRPWNEVTYDLVTARGSNKENGAVNFPLAHLEFGAVPLTSITTRVFLGQQIQCTQCHDHPSNDWKQADFWGINAFFKGVMKHEIMTTDASGAEVVDHIELVDEPSDAFA